MLSYGSLDLLNVLQVLFLGSAKYEDVRQLYNHKVFHEQMQNIIHHPR